MDFSPVTRNNLILFFKAIQRSCLCEHHTFKIMFDCLYDVLLPQMLCYFCSSCNIMHTFHKFQILSPQYTFSKYLGNHRNASRKM